ncbi:pyrroline-5-carboxylate reductase [Perilla frutescens var. hirtella]|uniref:Pyrroline-5-carboxylate reductase n=1 Tax=Perilla frutescens var. hirtella TaxID=608512 RepID=A0AAD4J7J7_PERFH|nr:pyrroline-5-carboxylate reductase [Perilla frutescens var. hirtella]
MVEEPSRPPPLIEQDYNSVAPLLQLMSKQQTWVFLFVSVYMFLLFLSWNLFKFVISWYEFQLVTSSSSWWPALYTSVLLGAAFGRC